MDARLGLDVDPSGLKAGASVAQTELNSLKGSASAATAEIDRMANGMKEAGAAAAGAGIAVDKMTGRVNSATGAHGAHSKATRSSSIATMEFDHVIRAMSDSVGAGVDPLQALRGEMGRIVEAFSLAGGGAGAFGKFMMGPWGIAIQIGAAVLVPLIAEMFAANEAFGKLEVGAYAVSTAQGALGDMFDVSTGKLKNNTEALLLNATAQAINLQARAAEHRESSNKAFETVGTPGFKQYALGYGAQIASAAGDAFMLPGTEKLDQYAQRQLGGNASVQGLMDRYVKTDAITDKNARAKAQSQIMLQAYGTKDWTGSGTSQKDFIQAIADRQQSQSETDAAADIMTSLRGGKLTSSLITPGKPKKPPKPKDPHPLEEFGLEAQHTIDDVFAKYDDTPTGVAAAQKQIEAMDTLMKKLGDRKPPGFKDMIAEAQQAEQVIRNGISKPFDDFVKAQHDSFQILQLTAAGRTDEADALKTELSLQKSMGPLTDQQKDAVLDTVQAMKAEQRQIEINAEAIQVNVTALESVKKTVEDATQAWERGDLGAIIKSPGKILDAFQTMQGQQLFDKMFGGVFQDLKDQASGTNIIKDASKAMGSAMDALTPKIERTSKSHTDMAPAVDTATSAVNTFAKALDAATGSVNGAGGAGPADTGTKVDSAGGFVMGGKGPLADIGDLVKPMSAYTALGGDLGEKNRTYQVGKQLGVSGDDPNDIVVTGQRQAKNDNLHGTQLFEKAIAGIGTSIVGLFTDHTNAESIGKSIGKYSGAALTGAATGSFVAGIGKSIGVNLNSTGSSLGGALGGVLGTIKGVTSALGPVGAALTPLLSIAGGVLGSLFGSTKYGGASFTNKGVTGTVGNTDAGKAAGTSSANAALSSINGILKQLGGGTVGDFGTITVGAYKDKFRVNDHGTNLKSNNDVLQYDTLEEAQAFALKQALSRGAVQTGSATINKIISSGTADETTALQNALTFKSVQDQAAQLADPINFALKALNTQFTDLKTIMDDAGASTDEYLNAEKVYQSQRQTIIEQGNNSALKDMRQYIFDLTGGTSSVLAPEQRYTVAKAELDKDDATKAAGGTVAFADYKAAADAFLAASRDSQGSTLGYFADLARVTGSVSNMIDSQGANVTTPEINLAPVTAAVNDQTDALTAILSSIDSKIGNLAGVTSSVATARYAVSLDDPRYFGLN